MSDVELPLMGKDQESRTFNTKDPSSSLAILDLLGSSRPKIYAIFQIINQRFNEEAKLIYDTYCVNKNRPSTQDQVIHNI